MNRITDTVTFVTADIETAGLEYVVVGSVAGMAHGISRATNDIDVVLYAPGALLEAWLDDFGVRNDDRFAISPFVGTMGSVFDYQSGFKVDLIAAAADDLAAATLRRRIRAEVLGALVWVSSAEDVVLAKLRWRVETRSERQWRDCGEIASTVGLDWRYMEAQASVMGRQIIKDLGDLHRQIESQRPQ